MVPVIIRYIVVITLISPLAFAECSPQYFETEVKTGIASASAISNLANADGSLKKEIPRLLSVAQQQQKNAKLPDTTSCAIPCTPQEKPDIVFKALPNQFLSGYSDEAVCNEHLHKTEQTPLIYEGKQFLNEEQFTRWFMNFSSGKGADGEDLYTRCPGSCSPRYTTYITSGAVEVKEALLQDIEQELNHAKNLANRIRVLGGLVPGSTTFAASQQTLQPKKDTTDVVSVIKGVIDAEDKAINQYKKIVQMSDGVDYVTQDLCIDLLGEEEAHRREFAGFLKEYDTDGSSAH